VVGFLILFCWVVFFMPAMGGFFLEAPNFEPANPLKTPAHIFPVWYFTPFYAILRAIPDKLMGVAAMGASIVVLALLPWIDRGSVRSVRYRCGFHKWNIAGFVVTFVLLGWVGATPQTDFKTIVSQVCTVTYFMFFVLLFVYSKNEKTKPLPERLTK